MSKGIGDQNVLFDDRSWLNDYADHGPFARAALGILVAKGDWGWWNGRSYWILRQALQLAIPSNGVAVWGGDEAVIRAQDWIDTALAIDLALAFRDVSARYQGLRLRIEREVWSWDALGNNANFLKDYLAVAVPARRVSFDWPQDRRPRLTPPNRQSGALVISTPYGDAGLKAGEIFTHALNSASSVRVGEWRPGEASADVLFATSIDALTQGRFSAELVIIANDDQHALVRALDNVRRLTGARCVVRVQEKGSDRWIEAFGRLWAGKLSAIDNAAAEASEEVGIQGEVVVSNLTFLLRSGWFPAPRADDRKLEFPQVYGFRARPDSVAVPKETKPLSTTPPPSARVLEIKVVDAVGKKLLILPISGAFDIKVAIQPQTPLTAGVAVFPDQRVAWDGDKRILQIHLLELEKDPITHVLELPRTGASPSINFQYRIDGSKPIDLRLMVCDGTQILQTARFQGKPGESYSVFIETDVTPLEDKPRTFDMALLINGSLGGKPSITTIADDRVSINIFEGHEVDKLRDEARKTLAAIAANPKIPFDDALKDLADVGSRTLKAMRAWVQNWPVSFSRVQLMTRVNAVFPFEFLYEGDLPLDADAMICPESSTCLSQPRGSSNCCTRRVTSDVFCPMGFVGLNAVIERHAWDGDAAHPFWLRRSEDFSRRDPLRKMTEIVFAASENSDNFQQDDTVPLDQRLARISDVEYAFGLGTKVDKWQDWRDAVAREVKPPSIAVLVPHVEEKKLFIGASDAQYLSNLSMGKAVVAIVLGCNTAEGEAAALSLPNTVMRDGRVRTVVAALTEVLGRYSNTAALILGTKIRAASLSTELTTVGDFVTDLRRLFLSKKIALGLVLISIGDADVVLGGQ